MNSEKIGRIKVEIDELVAVRHPYPVPDSQTLKYLGRSLEALHLVLLDLERRIEALEDDS